QVERARGGIRFDSRRRDIVAGTGLLQPSRTHLQVNRAWALLPLMTVRSADRPGSVSLTRPRADASRTSGVRSDRNQPSAAGGLKVFFEGRERALEVAQDAFRIARVEAERPALGNDLPLPRHDLAAFLHVALRYRERIDGHAAPRISGGHSSSVARPTNRS